MSDRQDLIQSELSGLSFDSLQVVFRSSDIEIMFTQTPPEPTLNAETFLFIDPAAGGPQSDYAILSFQRIKGLITVSLTLTPPDTDLLLCLQTRPHPVFLCSAMAQSLLLVKKEKNSQPSELGEGRHRAEVIHLIPLASKQCHDPRGERIVSAPRRVQILAVSTRPPVDSLIVKRRIVLVRGLVHITL